MAFPITRAKALREWRLYFFVVPSLVMVGVFAYFPAASAIYHSFFDWQGGETKQFIGWGNFQRIWNDGVCGALLSPSAPYPVQPGQR